MHAQTDREQALLAKLRELSDDRVVEVEDFVDFLRARDDYGRLAQAAALHTAAGHSARVAKERSPAGTAMPARTSSVRPTEADDQESRLARFNEVYEQYVRPVEQDHQGEYAAVTPDGQTIFGSTLVEV